jgi:hypothetical protein
MHPVLIFLLVPVPQGALEVIPALEQRAHDPRLRPTSGESTRVGMGDESALRI